MAGQYRAQNVLLGAAAQTVAASQTKQVVSSVFNITPPGGTRAIRVDLKASAYTAGAGITAKLQHAVDDTAANFSDVHATLAQVTVNATGWFSILLNAFDTTDSPVFPLLPHGRVVVTTGAGDAVTFSECRVTMEE